MKRDDTSPVNEEKLGYAMVKARLLSDNQLKTAFDYQRSLGGSLLDVIGKLGFVSPSALARFTSEMNEGPEQKPVRPSGHPPRAAAPEATAKEGGQAKRARKAAPPPPRPTRIDVEEDGSELPADDSLRAEESEDAEDGEDRREKTGSQEIEHEETSLQEENQEPEVVEPTASKESPPADDQASGPREIEAILQALIQLLIRKGVIRRKELDDMVRATCQECASS